MEAERTTWTPAKVRKVDKEAIGIAEDGLIGTEMVYEVVLLEEVARTLAFVEVLFAIDAVEFGDFPILNDTTR